MMQSAIYTGDVVHARVSPKPHKLKYSVFSLLLDIDALDALDRKYWIFGYNRPALISFYDRDHGPLENRPLRTWVVNELCKAGIEKPVSQIFVSACPRVFGYVFNPISVYFCYAADGDLVAVLYEVCNTFKERHTYVFGIQDGTQKVLKHQCSKQMYVSPFTEMDCHYKFSLVPPGETLRIAIRQENRDGLLLAASFSAKRIEFSNSSLLRLLAEFPLITFKIVAAIHWEAVQLWAKGIPYFKHIKAKQMVRSSSTDTP